MSIFSKDIIESDPCHIYYMKLIELKEYEYWKQHPEEVLEQLFMFHTGHPTKDFNDNESNVEEGAHYMHEVITLFKHDIASMFGFDGEPGYQLKMFTDYKRIENGIIIHQNNKNPDQPIWMQPFLGFTYRP